MSLLYFSIITNPQRSCQEFTGSSKKSKQKARFKCILKQKFRVPFFITRMCFPYNCPVEPSFVNLYQHTSAAYLKNAAVKHTFLT